MKLINRMPLGCWMVAVSVLALAARAAEEPKAAEPPKPPRQQLKAERLVSDNTFLYAATPDLRKARSALERTAFQALLAEEEVSQPVLGAFAKLREAYVRGDGTRGDVEMRRRSNEVELLAALAPLLENQVALAVEGDISSLLSSGTLPRFLLVAGMPPGEEGEKWQHQVEDLMKKHVARQGIDPRFKDFEDRTDQTGNYEVYRLENAEQGVFEAWAFVENLFLYGQGKRIVEDAIQRHALKNDVGTLNEHRGYKDAYDQAGKEKGSEALLYVQADMLPLLERFIANYPELKKTLDPKMAALEANRPHFAMGVYIAEGANAAIREKMLVRLGKEALPKSSGPWEAVTARFVQSDALFFSAEQANLAESYKAFMKSRKPSGPEAAGTADQEDPLGLKRALGVPTEADLLTKLELFKGEFAVALSYQPQPNLKMETWQDYLEMLQPVFVLELDRENAMAEDKVVKELLPKIEKATGQSYLPAVCGALHIFYQKGAAPPETPAAAGPLGFFRNLPAPPSDNKAPFFVAYAWADLDLEGGKKRKFLLLSDSLDALKTSGRVIQEKSAYASLGEDKKFKDLVHSFRESRNSVSYLDLVRLTDVYRDLLPRLARSRAIRHELLDQLPGVNVFRGHMFPMGWSTSVLTAPDGWLAECSSPMGNLPMLGVIGAVGWPVIVEGQQQAVSQEVDEKFRRLKLALHLYEADSNRFPARLSDLLLP
ncbi:MAG: hypothetical protein ABSE73_23285, partial [Planctomycetota bacterium]